MEKISRLPLRSESNKARLRNHKARCALTPDAEDINLATDWWMSDNTNRKRVMPEVADRAQRAWPQPRLEAVSNYSLHDWRISVAAVLAAGFGQFTSVAIPRFVGEASPFVGAIANLFRHIVGAKSTEIPPFVRAITNLLRDIFGATSSEVAYGSIQEFKEGRNLSYAETVVIAALEVACKDGDSQVMTAPRKEAIEQVACLAGLMAWNGKWEYRGYHRGHEKRWSKWLLERLLTNGKAIFKGSTEPLVFWEAQTNNG